MTKHPEIPPFQNHRWYYMLIKFGAIAVAVLAALMVAGVI